MDQNIQTLRREVRANPDDPELAARLARAVQRIGRSHPDKPPLRDCTVLYDAVGTSKTPNVQAIGLTLVRWMTKDPATLEERVAYGVVPRLEARTQFLPDLPSPSHAPALHPTLRRWTLPEVASALRTTRMRGPKCWLAHRIEIMMNPGFGRHTALSSEEIAERLIAAQPVCGDTPAGVDAAGLHFHCEYPEFVRGNPYPEVRHG